MPEITNLYYMLHLYIKLDSEPVQWTGKIYNNFRSLQPMRDLAERLRNVADPYGTSDWPIRLDVTHPNILP
jgi:hypothetical protein